MHLQVLLEDRGDLRIERAVVAARDLFELLDGVLVVLGRRLQLGLHRCDGISAGSAGWSAAVRLRPGAIRRPHHRQHAGRRDDEERGDGGHPRDAWPRATPGNASSTAARRRQRLLGEPRLQAGKNVGRQLEPIERERGRLNALQVSDQRTARRAALDVPLELALSRGIERAVDELGNRFAVVRCNS